MMAPKKCRIRKWLTVVVLIAVLAVVECSLAESGKFTNSTAWRQQGTDDSVLAAESLHRPSIFSIILSYLARPEENPPEYELADRSDDLTTAGQSWSRFTDSSIHLRVLRSASEEQQPEARALFFRRRASPTNPPRRQSSAVILRPSTAVAQATSAELVELLEDLYQRRRNHLVNGEAEETSATIEVVQTQTPFVITSNGQMIMNDLPMVERRSIPQFGGMVTLYTRKSPLRLLYYGNWCGSGGMGQALDEIDKCCMTHDQCYGSVEKTPCKVIFQKPYTVHYAWRWVEDRKQAYCLRTGDRCAEMTCECDRTAAACFAKHMINAKLEGNRLRKHRNRIKYPIRSPSTYS